MSVNKYGITLRYMTDWINGYGLLKGQDFHPGGRCQVILADVLCKGCTAVVSFVAWLHTLVSMHK